MTQAPGTMELRLHIGAHRTGTRHLRAMMARNRPLLEAEGVFVADPEAAEKAFAQALKKVRDGASAADANAGLMAALCGDRDWKRIVIVDPNISGSVLRPTGKEFFYPRISTTVGRIRGVLDGVPLRLFCALRNPATFIPSAYATQLRHAASVGFADYISETNLTGLRWSDFLHRSQLKKSELGITAWRFEDYPFIWRDVIEALTGIPNRELLEGRTDPVAPGLALRGALLMHEYLVESPAESGADFDRVRGAFLQKFPSSQGHTDPMLWPDELAEGMTENYEDDWYYIERMENIQTIQPRVYA